MKHLVILLCFFLSKISFADATLFSKYEGDYIGYPCTVDCNFSASVKVSVRVLNSREVEITEDRLDGEESERMVLNEGSSSTGGGSWESMFESFNAYGKPDMPMVRWIKTTRMSEHCNNYVKTESRGFVTDPYYARWGSTLVYRTSTRREWYCNNGSDGGGRWLLLFKK